ncbi:Farnesyl pyrophosphate synthase [Apis cerana cerana]|uniref:Farnesyl pyrophosphate synthase n=1 Tax=Apis cerana cerana TaxID=94128 RepID=A0A2A3E023_APICC|nr:Farnesyl pyrophosphate synthase [Apis cerana cerana]
MLPFSLAMRFAGIIDPEMHREAENILIKMGHFFQVQNDFLDYYSKEEIGGKSGTDIQEGKCTWPIVVVLERATAEQKIILKNTITRKSFITSLLKIAVKPIVLDTKLDEWIYGSNFTEQIKEARTMQKVCAGIKPIAKVSNKVRRLVDSFNDEKNKLMTVWPNIVSELTEDNNEELLDVNKWITEVLEYNVPKGGKRRSVSFVIACKLLTSQDQLTEENIRLAHILAWCIEIMQAVHTMADDILDHANMRRNQPAWHVKIGLFAVNDILLIETCIYKLIQKYFKSKECYGDIMNTFLKDNKMEEMMKF